MYEPPYDDEHMRLKRKERKEGDFSVGWMFVPAVIGMIVAVLLMVVLPSLVRSIGKQYKFDRIADEMFKVLNEEFTLLTAMQWGQTNVWIYLIGGALAGVFVRFSFGDGQRR